MAAAVTACAAEPSPEVAVRTFLLDWQAGDYESAARQTDGDVDAVAQALRQARDQLDMAALRLGLGPISREGDSATATFDVQADLGIGDPVWTYEGSMPLTRSGTGWVIQWSPAVIHPRLGDGERLAVTYDVPDRGQIYDRNENPLVGGTDVVAFGVRPAALDDVSEGVGALAELLGEDPEPLLNRVRSAPPEEFQPLVLMRRDDVAPTLLTRAGSIPGVETTELTMPLNPTMAAGVIGDVAGTVEHKVSSRVSGPYQAGDTVGLGGLQSVFQQQLAGTATTKIVTLDASGEQTEVLEEWPGESSGSLSTTLDSAVQEAAEGSLAGISAIVRHASVVAVDARSGEILAAASQPDSADHAGAFTDEYLPGEAFTIISAAALLGSGEVTADTHVPCEAELNVGDRTFSNAAGQLWGETTLTQDFASACTTAFASLGDRVAPEQVAETAAAFGVGGDWRLSVPTFPGEVSVADGAPATSAALVGAEGVRVSPLGMALAAGAVADGSWHAPRLVTDTEQAEEPEPGAELDPETVQALRTMMRATVQQGAGTGANVGTVPVHGQTGTARQEVDGEDTVVQWFVGFQGQVAFAAAVEVGPESAGYSYAVGSIADFLQRLPYDYVQDIGAGAAEGAQAAGNSAAGGGPTY
ncbi:cell division protein FtsI [Marinitenerispora sediminis]|uniref:Cell division protein FtsI n=2 Tax=Marinitenerispora sediminis TaxID=1931232 RepID=A0A368TAJ0_9ACTN|nr:cell division protein FtsI [Marinitenerispora sediminis]RCV61966.1 cell division protein FtsI [Marinitenerispora sediminis]RCV62040.1 cell division protein FtsI [Marinitenerispora sediminis]